LISKRYGQLAIKRGQRTRGHPPECRTIWQESKPFVCSIYAEAEGVEAKQSLSQMRNGKYLWGAGTETETESEADTGFSFWHKQFTIKSSRQPKGQQCDCVRVRELLPGKK